jgi:hypothetical protein
MRTRKCFLIAAYIAAAYVGRSAPATDPVGAALLEHTPGRRKAAPFVGSVDPFLDLAVAEPTRIEAKTVLSSAEVAGRVFASRVAQFVVTSAVLTADPDYRSVVVDKIPLRQGQTLPEEMFTEDMSGIVIVKEITSSSVVFEYTGRDSNHATAAVPYSLTFSKRRGKR